ncbi:Tropomodulin-2, partial [Cladochytrium tenue]
LSRITVEEVETKQPVDAVDALPDNVEVKDELPAEPPLPTLPPLVKTLVFDGRLPAGPDADNADAGTIVAEDVVTKDTAAAAAPEGSVVTAALNGDSAAPLSDTSQVNHAADGGEGTTKDDSASGPEAVAVDATKHIEVERAEGERLEAEAEIAREAQRDKRVKTQAVDSAASAAALVVERQSAESAATVAEVTADATGTVTAAMPPPDRADPPLCGVGVVHRLNPILDELLHALQLLAADDADLVVLDLRDCAVFAPPHAAAVAEALAMSSHLRELVLENTGLQTAAAIEIANALRMNETLEVLNLDSNNIAPAGALAESLKHNRGLRELRLAYQRSMAGTDAEQAFARAMAKNTTCA